MISNFRGHQPRVHKTAFVAPNASLIGEVSVGKDASVWYGAVLRGDINAVKIGAESNVQDNAVLHVEKNTPCIVKSKVTIGHQATVHACVVGDGCLIGIGARILNKANIGKYSLIAAGAVVLENQKIPPYSLVVGVPGKVVRKLTPKEIKALDQSAANYVRLRGEYKKTVSSASLMHSPELQIISDLSGIF